MQYLSENTRSLINETATHIVNTGKDPLFLVEAFMINNKNRFNEGALSNWWRDVKNWWRGGVGAVAAGRHDIEDEFNTARNALLTMITHIKKFRGSDPSTEEDILNLLNTTVQNLRTVEPLITSLGGKIKKRAAAQRDPSLFGGPEEYKPELDVAAFAELPVSNVKVEGGSKPIMNWYLTQASGPKKNLARSIVMNAKVRVAPSRFSTFAATDYEALAAASDPLIQSLATLQADLAVRNAEMYGRIFAFLYEKLLALRTAPKDAKYADLPEYSVETANMTKTEVNKYLNWMVRKGAGVITDVMKDVNREIPDLSALPLSGTKLNNFSLFVDNYKKAPTARDVLKNFNSVDLVRAVIFLNKKAQENLL